MGHFIHNDNDWKQWYIFDKYTVCQLSIIWVQLSYYFGDYNNKMMINKIGLRSFGLIRSVTRFAFALIKFPLPDLGEKIKEGTVKKLYVSEGERVQEFQKIADVESDKQFT